ncbi:MAG: FadR/GntR family transcriptional regulator [Pseudomonadota bacterium]
MSMGTDKRLYTEVVRQITDLIESGQFPPGSRLPGERDLATQFGVSRVTVREAQIALQATGRIEVRSGSGAKVLAGAPKEEQLPVVNAFELSQARTLFEGEAAALAAATITEDDLDKLDELVDEMAQSTNETKGLLQSADQEFHLTIARACNNAAILDTIERLWRFRTEVSDIKHTHDLICGTSKQDRIGEHRDIVKALRRRDAQAARKAMRRHFECIIETMLAASEREAIEEARRKSAEVRQRFLSIEHAAE